MIPWFIAGVLALGAASPGPAQAGTDQYDDTFRKYSKRYFGPGFDWRLFKAQAMAESNLDPGAKSWVGARGVMQLMPTTFREVQSKNPEFHSIDDPVWNIAAGICYDRQLWNQWADHPEDGDRLRFVLGSYNAGRGTLLRARSVAERKRLDPSLWTNIRTIAHEVPKWRHRETLSYVDRIETNLQWMGGGKAAPLASFPGRGAAAPRAIVAPPPGSSAVPAPASPPAPAKP